MRRILQPIRFVTILLSILVFLAAMAVVFLCVRRRWRRVWWSNQVLSYFCISGLFILGVTVHPIFEAEAENVQGGLYVGNHLSYLDVLVICSVRPSCFVTSVEVRDTPGLGLICRMAGCLFVERRNKLKLRDEVVEISEGLKAGLNVAIFPEATSTNGEQILRFRRPLYIAAIEARTPVVPFCLNYSHVGLKPIDHSTRDQVFWYGDMDFIPHLWALAGSGGVKVNLHFLKPLHPQPDTEPGDLAARSQAQVEAVFRAISKPPV
jgi:1-acyl-sn-glycerol-3-phosphate acyltransferase